MSRSIDINCDMGELPKAIEDGSQEAIMPFLTSINVACGGHAGDETTMSATIAQAKRWNLAIGAHPGYPDRANFGRLAMEMSREAIAQAVFEQVQLLAGIADRAGASLRHVKPHGALYNVAAGDASVAQAIVDGVSRCSRDLVLVGLAGSIMLDVFREAGFAVAAESFADRRYEPDGTLRARRFADALITEPALAARQVLDMVEEGFVTALDGSRIPVHAETICIHGDTAGAFDIAREVSRALRTRGIEMRSLAKA
jgi:UPF0271 protein